MQDGCLISETSAPRVGIIFDCDGVLIDSANVWRDTEQELCRRAGKPLSVEGQRAITTMTLPEVGVYLHKTLGLGENPAHVSRMIDELMFDFYQNRATPMAGILDFLAALQARGVAMSVVSSSPQAYLQAGLARIGAIDFFCSVISVEDLGCTKRDPDAFQEAMRRMGTTPENTWGFDDSYYANESMERLGITTVGVYDANAPYELDQLRAKSSLLCSSYAALDPEDFAAGPAQGKPAKM